MKVKLRILSSILACCGGCVIRLHPVEYFTFTLHRHRSQPFDVQRVGRHPAGYEMVDVLPAWFLQDDVHSQALWLHILKIEALEHMVLRSRARAWYTEGCRAAA